MIWELVSSVNGHEVYHLMNNGKMILSLDINSFTQTAKVECENEKRNFQVKREGILRNKIVLRNEYGVKFGDIAQDGNDGFILINDERFRYAIDNSSPESVSIYKDQGTDALVTCSLFINENKKAIDFRKNRNQLASASHPELLMALCWYLFLPVAKENLVEYVSW